MSRPSASEAGVVDRERGEAARQSPARKQCGRRRAPGPTSYPADLIGATVMAVGLGALGRVFPVGSLALVPVGMAEDQAVTQDGPVSVRAKKPGACAQSLAGWRDLYK
jgi:hypothetical protein